MIVPDLAERILVLEDYCCHLVLDLSPNSMSYHLTVNFLTMILQTMSLPTVSHQIANLPGNLLTVNQSLNLIHLELLNHRSSHCQSHYLSRYLSQSQSQNRSRSQQLMLATQARKTEEELGRYEMLKSQSNSWRYL